MFLGITNISATIFMSFKRIKTSYIRVTYNDTTYSSFKSDFSFEPYLQALSNPRFRMALTKFRVSANSLAIETGQHTGTERSMRKCVLCNMNVVESEFHFILCALFTQNCEINTYPDIITTGQLCKNSRILCPSNQNIVSSKSVGTFITPSKNVLTY